MERSDIVRFIPLLIEEGVFALFIYKKITCFVAFAQIKQVKLSSLGYKTSVTVVKETF